MEKRESYVCEIVRMSAGRIQYEEHATSPYANVPDGTYRVVLEPIGKTHRQSQYRYTSIIRHAKKPNEAKLYIGDRCATLSHPNRIRLMNELSRHHGRLNITGGVLLSTEIGDLGVSIGVLEIVHV